MNRRASYLLLILPTLVITMAACGGDDAGDVPSEILPAAKYEARCATPRVGKDIDNQTFPDQKGSLLDEQLWLRSWIDDTYLWYKEVPHADPKMFATALDYFNILKTDVKTASGKDKDQFHFNQDTASWLALSESGVEAGYGLTWAVVASKPPRQVVVAYVDPGSPADMQGIRRGAVAQTVDGVDVVAGADTDTLNNGLFPSDINQNHTIVILDQGASAPRTVTLTSASLTSTPVQRVALTGENAHVGYLLFNDHIATAEKGMIDQINALKAAGVDELVLDIRYNSGGYLAIASEVAYMIAGPASGGKVFDQLQFNDKHPTTDPVTGQPITPEPFLTAAQGFSSTAGTPLPSLGFKRVFILTSFSTASASEAVMNGLAGIDVQVIQIGTTTRGKPYGFYPTDNCGMTYFSIQFSGVNAKGFGQYSDGLTPGKENPGCVVADDFTHQLGDPLEARLAAALTYAKTGACPAVAARSDNPLSATEGEIRKPMWLQNAIMRRP